MERETRRKIKLEKDLKSTLTELEARSSDVKAKQNQLMKADEEYTRCEQQLRETRVRTCGQSHYPHIHYNYTHNLLKIKLS